MEPMLIAAQLFNLDMVLQKGLLLIQAELLFYDVYIVKNNNDRWKKGKEK
jgi:hypothetical protein